MLRLNFIILTAAIVALIAHGSLYPYDFHMPQGDAGAWQALLASRATPPSSLGDLVANILLYTPFGLFGTLALRGRPLPRLLIIAGAGLVLCTLIELAQFYDRGRVTNMSDVYLNTFGSLLGAVCAFVFDGVWRAPVLRDVSTHPVPVMLLAAMLGYRLFPYVPTIDLHEYWQSLKPVFLTPEIAPYPVFYYFALWLAASYLVASIVPNYRRIAPALFCAFVLSGGIVIIDRVLTVPELSGAGLAVLAATVLPPRRRGTALFVALVLGTMVVLWRLEPFTFHAPVVEFGWMPFQGFIEGPRMADVQAFAEKFFLYGSCIWILRQAGLRLRYAAAVTAALLLVTSYVEIYLPGRSAEITDAVMSLLVAAIIGMLDAWNNGYRRARPGTRATPDAALRLPPRS
jgi:VanZ family protein